VELTVRGRGIRITDQIRRTAEHKLGKLQRVDPRIGRCDVEVIDLNPRVGASQQVEVTCDRGRRRFRAVGTGQDVESALDQVVEHLERQISSYRGKLRHRILGRRDRLQSPRTSAEGSNNSE
jgi:putative sigma-54 modulation protein